MKAAAAEIGAYRNLYPDVKQLTFPIFKARPWQNANSFQLTLDRVIDAAGGYPFGLALDGSRFEHTNEKEAQVEFDALFNQANGFEAYYGTLANIRGAVPVLLPTTSRAELARQINNADRLDRGLIVHQQRGIAFPHFTRLFAARSPLPHDTVFVVDAGWSRDYQALEAWTMPVVDRINGAIPEAEIAVVSSSFPSSFRHIIGHSEESGTERVLFATVRQRFNSADLTYGDWGSTRPSTTGGGGKIPSRVDLPRPTSWDIFRSDPDNDLGFSEMAWQASHYPSFQQTPSCWGKEMISITDDQGNGIQSRQSAATVRLNIHMTLQSGADSNLPLDEAPYQD
ncbi:beta family protein [Sphingomonas taxi]|uniref:beta family protein n=1 Tax=Sphingomonas taxi TaxID=1549858 RepID=UPI0009DDF325|nr:hypothetical protein [Sphingomonas taxi]